jgi:hypothetical protein
MKMSVFRQGGVYEQLDHLAIIKLAVGKSATAMILHARLHNATILVGLPSGQSVIKPYEENDEASRFEDLYDTAISLHDFTRMQQQKVRSPEDLAPHLYEMELLLIQERPISIRLRLKSKNQFDVPAMLQRLVREDIEFGTELYSRLAMAMMKTSDGSIETAGPLKILDEAPAGAPEWEFIPRQSDDR